MYQKIKKDTNYKKLITALVLSGITLVSFVFITGYFKNTNEKTDIKLTTRGDIGYGRVTQGANISSIDKVLQTEDKLTFVSEEIHPPVAGANAAVLEWSQSGSSTESSVELRTRNEDGWSNWYPAASNDERKDGTKELHNALVIGTAIEKVQYRFVLSGHKGQPSPIVDLSNAKLQMIDSTKGPSPTGEKSLLQKIVSAANPFKPVSARMDGPRIISRTEWGSPDGEGSPRWAPEYEPLNRVIIHHTAIPPNADVAASIRAIWQYHANTNGWGDIGYNYLVDPNGNIYQGRAFDPNTAYNSKKDVVGGHAYGNNYGTSGIAALGDFSNVRPSDRMVDSIANIAAFKAANYSFNPSGIGAAGPNLVGHRDVRSTACPGAQLYARLQEVRNVGDIYYEPRARMNKLDLTNQGQGFDNQFSFSTEMASGSTKTLYFKLKNEGDDTWFNSGDNPIILAPEMPKDRSSIFADGGWIAPHRAATFQNKVQKDGEGNDQIIPASEIAPGEVAYFQFTITAPDSGGIYREHFQLLSERREWFARDLQLSATIRVVPAIYSWRPTAQHIYTDETKTVNSSTTSMNPGQRVYLVVEALNTGNQTWYKDGQNPLRIGTSNGRDRVSLFCDDTWINCSRPALIEEDSVNPGQVGTFEFWIRAPQNAGIVRNEYFSLVVESKEWINTEPGIYWPVSIH